MTEDGQPEKEPEEAAPDVLTSAVEEEDLAALKPSPKRLKKFIYVGQAIAIAAVAAYGAARPTGEREARVGYSESARQITTLQAYVMQNEREMDSLKKEIEQQTRAAAGRCKAEVQSIRMYVTGYLLALSRTGNRTRVERDKTDEALQELLSKATKGAPLEKPQATAAPSAPASAPVGLPKLRKPPASLDAVMQQKDSTGL